jgi:hypothetical protein
MPKLQTLFGDGYAVVVGLPKNFDLSRALQFAKEIRLGTAFAHRSGWTSLRLRKYKISFHKMLKKAGIA